MRVEVAMMVVGAFHVAAPISTGSHAFILPDKRCATTTPIRSSGQQSDRGHNGRVLEGPLIDLRGGKSVRSEKSVGGSKTKSKTSSKASKSSKTSKSSSSKRRKPSFVATIKAFFASLMNPHFALKLKAKQKNQVHTVHGSASTVGAS